MKVILKAVALGMGVSSLVLNILGDASGSTTAILLSIGLVCLAIVQLQNK